MKNHLTRSLVLIIFTQIFFLLKSNGQNVSGPGGNFSGIEYSLPSGSSCSEATALSGCVLTIATNGIENEDGSGSDGLNAIWYSYVAPNNGYINVNSCFGGADTRLIIHDLTAFNGDCSLFDFDNLTEGTDYNDDECFLYADNSGNQWASNLTYPVSAGKTYLIEWDDRWSNDPFTWKLRFECSDLSFLTNDPSVYDPLSEIKVSFFTSGKSILEITDNNGFNHIIDDPVSPHTFTGLNTATEYIITLYNVCLCDGCGTSQRSVKVTTEGICQPADINANIINDCLTGADNSVFGIQIDLIDMGTASNITLYENNTGVTIQTLSNPQTYFIGGIDVGNSYDLTAIPDDDAFCTVDLGLFESSCLFNQLEVDLINADAINLNLTCSEILEVNNTYINPGITPLSLPYSVFAKWYSFIAPATGSVTVESCSDNPPVDTYLAINSITDGLVEFNDDGCQNSQGSVINNFPVTEGQTYLIEWGDLWSQGPFDWTISYNTECESDFCTFGGQFVYDPLSCSCELSEPTVYGCTVPGRVNYDPLANCDDGSCPFDTEPVIIEYEDIDICSEYSPSGLLSVPLNSVGGCDLPGEIINNDGTITIYSYDIIDQASGSSVLPAPLYESYTFNYSGCPVADPVINIPVNETCDPVVHNFEVNFYVNNFSLNGNVNSTILEPKFNCVNTQFKITVYPALSVHTENSCGLVFFELISANNDVCAIEFTNCVNPGAIVTANFSANFTDPLNCSDLTASAICTGIFGCTNPAYCEYDPNAGCNDFSCATLLSIDNDCDGINNIDDCNDFDPAFSNACSDDCPYDIIVDILQLTNNGIVNQASNSIIIQDGVNIIGTKHFYANNELIIEAGILNPNPMQTIFMTGPGCD